MGFNSPSGFPASTVMATGKLLCAVAETAAAMATAANAMPHRIVDWGVFKAKAKL
jgi:hypothetical protein